MKLLLILLLITAGIPVFGQRSYFYVEVESQDSTEYEYIFGNYQYDVKENEFSKRRIDNLSGETFQNKIEELLDQSEEREIFIYVHGMWGHQDWYQEGVLSTFENKIFSSDKSPQVVISFIWHSGIQYYDNVKHAKAVGRYFSPLLNNILKIPDVKINMLCHSMGNRVFQGMYAKIDNDQYSSPPINELFMVAADLEHDIFEESQPLEHISEVVNKASIYVHNNDRSLGISKSLNDNLRLGLNADKNICLQDSCLQIIDVSIIQDNEGIGPSLSNHRYFYTSPTVRNDLKLALARTPNPGRKPIDHSRRLQLLPLEEK